MRGISLLESKGATRGLCRRQDKKKGGSPEGPPVQGQNKIDSPGGAVIKKSQATYWNR